MSIVGEHAHMYIGGAWVGAASRRMMRVTNPATGEVLADLPDGLARLITQENGKPFEEAKREVAFATG